MKPFLALALIFFFLFTIELRAQDKKNYAVYITDSTDSQYEVLLLAVSDTGVHYVDRKHRRRIASLRSIEEIKVVKKSKTFLSIVGIAAIGNIAYGLTETNNVLHGAAVIVIGTAAITGTSYLIDKLFLRKTLLKVNPSTEVSNWISLKSRLEPYTFKGSIVIYK